MMNHVSPRLTQPLGYNGVSARWRALFGRPARKIPLDAGFSCPNRDGTISRAGCSFCNAQGSGTGLGASMTLTEQWELWRERRKARWGDVALVGYLQAFSNTHGPASQLAAALDELSRIPDISGLCIGTRPDCLDEEKLGLLAAFPVRELWLELGLQTSNPATLARAGRGHGPDCFARACEDAARRGIKVVAHVIAGLPGDTPDDWDETIRFVDRLPVAGVKFHNLFVARGTALEREHRAGRFAPPGLDEYAAWVARSVARLGPEVVIHRMAADPAHGELVAPDWAGYKRLVHNTIQETLRRLGVRQGMDRRQD
ncbi:MAG: TIGR01212 family radical SAM protein [Thermodesulfobacteriota bacterium]|jgi:radical SAM protein (TIGR01212 family)